MIYGVFYYDVASKPTSVYLAGYYNEIDHAKQRLANIVPNYTQSYKNSVKNSKRIAWINQYIFGDIENDGLVCNQPHNSVNLYN